VLGFNAVKQVKASLIIDWNSNLEEFSTFSEVRSIAGQLNFYNNDSLKVIEGLSKIKTSWRYLYIRTQQIEAGCWF